MNVFRESYFIRPRHALRHVGSDFDSDIIIKTCDGRAEYDDAERSDDDGDGVIFIEYVSSEHAAERGPGIPPLLTAPAARPPAEFPQTRRWRSLKLPGRRWRPLLRFM